MKLLLDQNISRKLVKKLNRFFPGTNHVGLLGLQEATDETVWNFARDNNFVIVTQDSDFYERSLIFGFPPKTIWLQTDNTSTTNLLKLLSTHSKDILLFEKDKKLGCLHLF